MENIPVIFKWISVQPDKRQWKPSQPLLEPVDVFIRLDVPEEFAEITSTSKVILSAAGMRFCVDTLEAVMSDPAKPDNSSEEFEKTKKEPERNVNAEEEEDEWA